MTTQEVADKLVQWCREGQFEKVYTELYSPDVMSIEPEGAQFERVEGMDALRKKGKEWDKMVEAVHSSEVSDPIVAENFFSCTMKMSVTMKGNSEPTQMDEVCVYHVVDGKVISEQFFYTAVPQEVAS